jgi:TusE/DsrC/DsvC family sulfur relay protein
MFVVAQTQVRVWVRMAGKGMEPIHVPRCLHPQSPPMNDRSILMNQNNQDFPSPGHETAPVKDFPHAPASWSRAETEALAQQKGLTLTETHWAVVRALQDICARSEAPVMNARFLHDALDERFHALGGIRHLYTLFPKGPLAQGCLLAGLEPPGGTQDQGFGSAV